MRLVSSLLLIACLQARAVDSLHDLQAQHENVLAQLDKQSKLYKQLLAIAQMHYPTTSRIVFELKKRNQLIYIDNQLWYHKDTP